MSQTFISPVEFFNKNNQYYCEHTTVKYKIYATWTACIVAIGKNS